MTGGTQGGTHGVLLECIHHIPTAEFFPQGSGSIPDRAFAACNSQVMGQFSVTTQYNAPL